MSHSGSWRMTPIVLTDGVSDLMCNYVVTDRFLVPCKGASFHAAGPAMFEYGSNANVGYRDCGQERAGHSRYSEARQAAG
jgi:hypothetical protein